MEPHVQLLYKNIFHLKIKQWIKGYVLSNERDMLYKE